MPRVLRLKTPPGFDLRATVEVMRRGPADPLNWFDGHTWRRFFTLDARSFLLEASWDDGLVVRTRSGDAPPGLVAQTAGRCLGLDDPGRALARLIPVPIRPLVRRHTGALLPGYPSLFEALVHVVLGQQLSAHVANRHRAAFVRVFGGCHRIHGHDYWTFPNPDAVADVSAPRLRSLGLSRVKAHAIRAIARTVAEGRLREESLKDLTVDAAIGTLTDLPGVGRWTSEWVLLRALRRFDVVPAGDLAVRKAVGWLLRSRTVPPEQKVRDAAVPWFPYGGLVAYRLVQAHRLSAG